LFFNIFGILLKNNSKKEFITKVFLDVYEVLTVKICTCNQKSLSKIILNIEGSMVLLMNCYARKGTASPTTCHFLLTVVP
jgi:hypothetical protein